MYNLDAYKNKVDNSKVFVEQPDTETWFGNELLINLDDLPVDFHIENANLEFREVVSSNLDKENMLLESLNYSYTKHIKMEEVV